MQALRDPSGITSRQREVIELIAQGLSNDEVGVALGISPRTAKAHCDVLRQKLGVTRRRQIPRQRQGCRQNETQAREEQKPGIPGRQAQEHGGAQQRAHCTPGRKEGGGAQSRGKASPRAFRWTAPALTHRNGFMSRRKAG